MDLKIVKFGGRMGLNKYLVVTLIFIKVATAHGVDSAVVGQGVSDVLKGAVVSNNSGTSANQEGAMLHQMIATAAAAKAAACTGPRAPACMAPPLMVMIANLMMGSKANQQANNHIDSNLGLMPDVCKLATGFCNPNNPNDPKNPIPTTASETCPAGDTACTACRVSPATCDKSKVGKPPEAVVNACAGNIKCKLAIPDPKTGEFELNGKKGNISEIKTKEDLKEMLGMSDEQLAQLDADMAKTAAQAGLKSGGGLDGLAADKNKDDGAGNLSGLDSLSGSGSSSSSSDGDANAALADGKARGIKTPERTPSNVAGLSKNFNGEQIGVAEDNIFAMMNRRYQTKDKQNSFLDPAVVAP